eukprot:693021-Rhodomonas_salina.3
MRLGLRASHAMPGTHTRGTSRLGRMTTLPARCAGARMTQTARFYATGRIPAIVRRISCAMSSADSGHVLSGVMARTTLPAWASLSFPGADSSELSPAPPCPGLTRRMLLLLYQRLVVLLILRQGQDRWQGCIALPSNALAMLWH